MVPTKNPNDPHVINGVPRVTDETLAALLGLKNRKSVRSKIAHHKADLSALGDLVAIDFRLPAESQRFCSFWLLNEKQAVFIANKCWSPSTGDAVRAVRAMIRKMTRMAPKTATLPENVIPITQTREA